MYTALLSIPRALLIGINLISQIEVRFTKLSKFSKPTLRFNSYLSYNRYILQKPLNLTNYEKLNFHFFCGILFL